MDFICPLCGNKDKVYIGYRNKVPYCRKCISFIGEKVDDSISYLKDNKSKAYVNYPLSELQEKISKKVLFNYINKVNTLIYAVCGAGKTELVFKVIEYALKNNKRVGFAIPRRDVVVELARRLQHTFKENIVTSVYGGNTNLLTGDIVCLTTHQLYRYEKYFDLLILDEIDAFPYLGNDVLTALFLRSIKGNYVLMSATPDASTLAKFNQKGYEILTLFVRYHKHKIPVPRFIFSFSFLKYLYVIFKVKRFILEQRPCLIFAPTIDLCEQYFSIINLFIKEGSYVHSKRENRGEIIDKFRDSTYKFLVTTSVLERGVTLKNLNVIIVESDHNLFNSSSLIQISGRVGRVKGAEDGEVLYIGKKYTKEMEKAIAFTKRANSYL